MLTSLWMDKTVYKLRLMSPYWVNRDSIAHANISLIPKYITTAFDSCNDRQSFLWWRLKVPVAQLKIGNNENICCRKDQDPILSISAFNLQKEIKMHNY